MSEFSIVCYRFNKQQLHFITNCKYICMFITEVYPSSAYETPPCHIVFLESQKLSLDYVVWTHQYFIVNVTWGGRVFIHCYGDTGLVLVAVLHQSYLVEL